MKYFGTDGIRKESSEFFCDDLALKVGYALAALKKEGVGKIIIGKDTRTSGNAIEDALVCGLLDSGAEILLAGVIPTPAVAYLTLKEGADFGIMISASHNPPNYNGIKIFNGDGYKLPDTEQELLEEYIDGNMKKPREGGSVNKIDARSAYVNYAVDFINADFTGKKIVIDCGYGASSYVASEILRRLGAEVQTLCEGYCGELINVRCGSTDLSNLKMPGDAYLGLSFDGDADRVLAKNSRGDIIDGDGFLYVISRYMKSRGLLKNDTVAGTVLTNMKLQSLFSKSGISLLRTDVGDIFVQEAMAQQDLSLGGEQSGHIILDGELKTGDGIVAGCMLIKAFIETNIDPADFKYYYEPCPSLSVDIKTDKDRKEIINRKNVQAALKEAENMLGQTGFIVLRASGTEPKIRITVQSLNPELTKSCGKIIEIAVKKEISV